ncbi:hypothetical protein ACMD2_19638 [Ananas comosus]|uniref:Uncharacterized protein n=1 Tax=Ananas comosus TaxID=4615 RepID=A0A199VAR2_ANACO|nr:hypothetical protein ACMD2_19638 [Ananas comosus]
MPLVKLFRRVRDHDRTRGRSPANSVPAAAVRRGAIGGGGRLGIQASRPVVWYVVVIVRGPAPKQRKRCVPHSRGTASEILEEGGDDVKSAWPLWLGTHVLTMQ